jgi:hypothetical protein
MFDFPFLFKKEFKMKISLFFLLILHSLISFSKCPTATMACSSITDQSQCGNYYLQPSCTENTTTTYCTQCSACIAGYNDCIKGAKGCKKCEIKNGKHTCTGTACKWGKYCYNGGPQITCSK